MARVITEGIIFVIEENGIKEEWMIVPQGESDPSRNRISIQSPFAQALLGQKKGARVMIKAPGGEYEVVILEIDENGG
ncbi:MAG: GreA/GreB family elongation factor [bacterium]|nr:GreA/GreB family elongation factor [bacterium]